MFVTSEGIGMSSDSVFYYAAGQNILNGNGINIHNLDMEMSWFFVNEDII